MKGKYSLFGALIIFILIWGLFLIFFPYYSSAKKEKTEVIRKIDSTTCFRCHKEIEAFVSQGKHKKLECSLCHNQLNLHVNHPEVNKAFTSLELSICGKCHKDQYESFVSANLGSLPKVEKATTTGRSPLFDNLMSPHGFTREHAEPRSHVFSLVDHLLVDRAYGGRFQLKDWTKILEAKAAEKSAWEILKDLDPKDHKQKIFPPYTPRTAALAANPVCLTCKTTDYILEWAYLGEKHFKAKWDRTSNVVEMARSMHRPFGCIHCHDPHSAQPRIVKDALIEAILDRGKGTYPYDPEKSKKVKVTKVIFRNFRAIGILNQPDAVVLCAQCHVEYTCNPVIDIKTGKIIPMTDPRTNQFQWVNVLDYDAFVEAQGYRDFRHEITQALLSKIQHPEVETYWGSKHERAGVTCAHCHMPKVKNKQGKIYTYHGQRSIKYVPGRAQVCVNCHKYWTLEEAEYTIQGIQNYIRGKIRKAEFWLNKLVDTYLIAEALGVSEEILAKARELHTKAHTKWEWWTAENSEGFHNPELAKASLFQAIQYASDGVTLLEKAIQEKRNEKK